MRLALINTTWNELIFDKNTNITMFKLKIYNIRKLQLLIDYELTG